MAFVDRPIEDMLSAIAMCAAHYQHLSSSCLDLHHQELPDKVCVAEGTDHPELDVSFLLHICGEVTSIG